VVVLFILFTLTMPLLAQRHELAIHFGTTLTQRREIALPAPLQPLLQVNALREDNGLAGGIVYRVRVAEFGPAALLAEVPVFIVQATNTDLLPAIAAPVFANTSGASGYFTPGAVLRFASRSRLSPYVFFGGGYAYVVEARLRTSGGLRGEFAREGTWAVNYGGGADLRIAGPFNLRAELRNFYTGAPASEIALPAETRQRNSLL
jgi:hypothetical protein